MRVVLFTGKGGVGKTTAAAGTATLAARQGLKSLVVSTDLAHSLGDVFGVPVDSRPTEVEPGLYVLHHDSRRAFERSWAGVRRHLVAALDAAGVDEIRAEELSVIPGAEEILALQAVRDQVRSGAWDLVVVDCAPTAETLRLLTLPEALGWYVERLFPLERRVARALRPVLGSALPMPGDRLLDALTTLQADLADVRNVLTDEGTTVRLVLTPESVVIAEARRTLTSLALFGYRTDGVVANRVFPDAGPGEGWQSTWVAAQRSRLDEVEHSFAPLPVWRSPYAAAEPLGPDALAEWARAAYGDADPLELGPKPELLTVERDGEDFVLALALPLADRSDLDLVRLGDEVVVTVGQYRRIISLPSALRRCTVVSAALRDGSLRVRFRPDPDLWMQP